jgi:hypothetical protein
MIWTKSNFLPFDPPTDVAFGAAMTPKLWDFLAPKGYVMSFTFIC